MVLVAVALAVWFLRRPADVARSARRAENPSPAATHAQSSVALTKPFYQGEISAAATAEDLKKAVLQAAGRLAERFPNVPDALVLWARVQYVMGRKEEAVGTWEKCVRLDPGRLEALRGLAREAQERGDYDSVAASCRKILSAAPRDREAPAMLAEALVKLDRTEELVAELEGIAKRGSPSAEVALALGQAQLRLRHYEKARLALEAVLQADPANKSAHYALATVDAMLGREEASREHREAFRKLSLADLKGRRERIAGQQDLPSLRQIAIQTYRGAGRVYARYGDTASAEAMWRDLAVLDRKDVESRSQLASLYERTDRLEEALRMCEQLRDIQPSDPDHWLNVALLNARLGRFDAAVPAIQKAIQLDPQNRKYREGYEAIQKSR